MDEQPSGQDRAIGGVRAIGLVVAAIAAMYGIVLFVNPGHYGVGGAVTGAVLALGGLAATIRFLRGHPEEETSEGADNGEAPEKT